MTLVEWLAESNMLDIVPASVTIGDVTYEAAFYVDPGHPNKERRLICLGKNPLVYGRKLTRRKHRVCFTVNGDAHTWYVACYSTEQTVKDAMPDGQHMFILMRWPWADENGIHSIDFGAKTPYQRIKIQIRELNDASEPASDPVPS